jgi:hypothetical protein
MTPNPAAPALIVHDGVSFNDAIVPLTGHSYRNCKFVRCTFFVKGPPFELITPELLNCSWHVDMIVFDQNSYQWFQRIMQSMGVRREAPGEKLN